MVGMDVTGGNWSIRHTRFPVLSLNRQIEISMMNNLRNNKDFFAGLMFIVIGTGAVFIARDYPIGSATRMGPGYFPVALGGLLFLFGVYIMVQGVIKKVKMEGTWSMKAWIILPISTVIFGYLMDHGGFVPALLALVFISAAAGNEFKFREVLIMALLLTVGSVGLFIYALEMPYPLFPWSQ
jgi:hypothetical protein